MTPGVGGILQVPIGLAAIYGSTLDRARSVISTGNEFLDTQYGYILERARKIEALKKFDSQLVYANKYKISNPKLNATTAEDGSYRIEHLVSDAKYAVMAHKGDRYWFVWYQHSGDKRLDLAQDNEQGTKCGACIFPLGKTLHDF